MSEPMDSLERELAAQDAADQRLVVARRWARVWKNAAQKRRGLAGHWYRLMSRALDECHKAEAERDAALARVARLESALRDVLALEDGRDAILGPKELSDIRAALAADKKEDGRG